MFLRIPAHLVSSFIIAVTNKQGCILNLKFIFLPPPPLLDLYFFPNRTLLLWGGNNFQPFFLQFCIFQVNRGKNMHNFYQLGKKYAFSPLFVSPLNNFFPQPVIWPYFCPPGGGANRKIYTPVLNKTETE